MQAGCELPDMRQTTKRKMSAMSAARFRAEQEAKRIRALRVQVLQSQVEPEREIPRPTTFNGSRIIYQSRGTFYGVDCVIEGIGFIGLAP
jgi:hypothetical protein